MTGWKLLCSEVYNIKSVISDVNYYFHQQQASRRARSGYAVGLGKGGGMLTFIMDIWPVGFANKPKLSCLSNWLLKGTSVVLRESDVLTQRRVEPMATTDSIGLLDRITRNKMEWFNSVLYSKFQTLNLLQVHWSKCPSGCKYHIGEGRVTI